MAKNLRTKIPASDTMFIHDVNPTICEKFASEHKGVTVSPNVRELAEHSVGHSKSIEAPNISYDEHHISLQSF